MTVPASPSTLSTSSPSNRSCGRPSHSAIVPDVPVEAQGLPPARQLARALDGAPIRRSAPRRRAPRGVPDRWLIGSGDVARRASPARRTLARHQSASSRIDSREASSGTGAMASLIGSPARRTPAGRAQDAGRARSSARPPRSSRNPWLVRPLTLSASVRQPLAEPPPRQARLSVRPWPNEPWR